MWTLFCAALPSSSSLFVVVVVVVVVVRRRRRRCSSSSSSLFVVIVVVVRRHRRRRCSSSSSSSLFVVVVVRRCRCRGFVCLEGGVGWGRQKTRMRRPCHASCVVRVPPHFAVFCMPFCAMLRCRRRGYDFVCMCERYDDEGA